jgi:hypothetical protein
MVAHSYNLSYTGGMTRNITVQGTPGKKLRAYIFQLYNFSSQGNKAIQEIFSSLIIIRMSNITLLKNWKH